jgi:L-threonylcarbamoyladenylate synthase
MGRRIDLGPGTDPAPAVAAAAEALAAGGVIVFPTETFYGLGCDPRSPEAVRHLVALKGREPGKPLPLIACHTAAARAAVLLAPGDARHWEILARRFWPGPLTIVAPASPGLAPEITAGSGEVGVRVSSLDLARRLAEAAGGLIVATSANRGGSPPGAAIDRLDPGILAACDLTLAAGATPGGLPSTVVRVASGNAVLLREGAIATREVEAALGVAVQPPAAAR